MVSDETSPPDHKALADLLAPLKLVIPRSVAEDLLEDFITASQLQFRRDKDIRLARNKDARELIDQIATAGKKYSDLLMKVTPAIGAPVESASISNVLLSEMIDASIHIKAHAALASQIAANANVWRLTNTHKGRPTAEHRQRIVFSAHSCWMILTETEATTTPTGGFGGFAYDFESLVTGEEPQDNARVLKQCVPMLNREYRIQKLIDEHEDD